MQFCLREPSGAFASSLRSIGSTHWRYSGIAATMSGTWGVSASRSRWTRLAAWVARWFSTTWRRTAIPARTPALRRAKRQDTSNPMHPSRPFHHSALRIGPALLLWSAAGCSPIPRGTAAAGSRAWHSRTQTAPPIAVPPDPAVSPSACESATRGSTEPGSRGSVGKYRPICSPGHRLRLALHLFDPWA